MKKLIALAALFAAASGAHAWTYKELWDTDPVTQFSGKIENLNMPCVKKDGRTFGVIVGSKERGLGCIVMAGHGGEDYLVWENGPRQETMAQEKFLAEEKKTGGVRQSREMAITAQPRIDEYGRPMKSVREICNEVRAAGGVITQTCAMDNYMQSIGR